MIDRQYFLNSPLCLLLGILLAASARAEDMPDISCRIHTVPGPATAAVSAGTMSAGTIRSGTVVKDLYRRGANGDWEVADTFDSTSAGVRLLLHTPDGPLLVELQVLVNGRSFRTARERWIHEVLTDSVRLPAAAVRTAEQTETPQSAADTLVAQAEPRVDPRPVQALRQLQEYVALSEDRVDQEEARWLLAQWTPGPELLELKPRFAGERARLAPLWAALDWNTNGELSAREMRLAAQHLSSLDQDEDEWVTVAELQAQAVPAVPTWAQFPLITVLNSRTDWDELANRLTKEARAEGEHSLWMQQLRQDLELATDEELQPDSVRRLLQLPAQVALLAEFVTQADSEGQLRLTGLRQQAISMPCAASAWNHVIELSLPRCRVEISAIRSASGNQISPWMGQIAVGAVIDGRPLLRQLDRDNNQRLSMGEVEQISGLLTSLDRDTDGKVSLADIQVPLRLTLTLGPYAHTALQNPVAAPAPAADTEHPAPDWFAGMDSNRDGELTAGEFLGTPEQFQQLDGDRNGRISLKEAGKIR